MLVATEFPTNLVYNTWSTSLKQAEQWLNSVHETTPGPVLIDTKVKKSPMFGPHPSQNCRACSGKYAVHSQTGSQRPQRTQSLVRKHRIETHFKIQGDNLHRLCANGFRFGKFYFSYANKSASANPKFCEPKGIAPLNVVSMSALTVYSDYDFEKRFCHDTLLSKAAVDMSNAIIFRRPRPKQNTPHACGNGISHKSSLQYMVYISETG